MRADFFVLIELLNVDEIRIHKHNANQQFSLRVEHRLKRLSNKPTGSVYKIKSQLELDVLDITVDLFVMYGESKQRIV